MTGQHSCPNQVSGSSSAAARAELNQLPIAADVSAALLNREGPLGRVLTSCLAYEQGEWTSAVPDGMTPSCVRDCYLESLAWAKSMFMIEG